MARKRKQQKQNQRTFWIIGGVLAAVLIAAFAFNLFPTTSVPSATLVDPETYQTQFGDGADHVLIDVRTPEEYASGHIANSININVDTLTTRLDEVPQDVPIVVYCRSGNRSATAAKILIDNGYDNVYDLGGIQTWLAQGFPIE